jgi:hypothetical protein
MPPISSLVLSLGAMRKRDWMVLLNGSYVIRLSSTTAAGTATAQLGAVVRKNLKIGNVSLAFSDATIAAGLPITLVRSYDGRAPVDSTLSSRMSRPFVADNYSPRSSGTIRDKSSGRAYTSERKKA